MNADHNTAGLLVRLDLAGLGLLRTFGLTPDDVHKPVTRFDLLAGGDDQRQAQERARQRLLALFGERAA